MSLAACNARHTALVAQLEQRLELTAYQSYKVKAGIRAVAVIAEIHAMRLLLREYGIVTRSTRQADNPRFADLPCVRDVAADHGLELPGFVVFEEEEIEARDAEEGARDENDELEVVLDPVEDIETDLV